MDEDEAEHAKEIMEDYDLDEEEQEELADLL